ncbi:DNA topoisomerase IB [Rhodovarius crocodyli]|uniref:DNA topoisomerase IB n=1 Tax=Rhodovarius crocodyli TaxID=1979269 RepID=A0A437MJR6_9PROT|nr:DNA topoisomerase IB [Rhodovarius crocodyli]RVT97873.1 DNA topoisomerase IB [Rhodovarius crocodyli]
MSHSDGEAAGLRYVSAEEPGIRREGMPGAFTYRDARGRLIRGKAALERIRRLAVPPAYTDVWICATADGHLQATGRDARGRRQYRYHPDWRAARDGNKFTRLLHFARGLPALRERVLADIARPGLPREKVLATVVWLLEATLARVGNEEYARLNKSFGLTTLRNRHLDVKGGEMRFHFTGKGGKPWRVRLQDRRIARILRHCQDLPGQALFQYRDEDGGLQSVGSADVNGYLREITGEDVTAKDFRTWAGTVLAALELAAMPAATGIGMTRAQAKEAIARTSARLGNTPTICRKCYIHPAVLEHHAEGKLRITLRRPGGKGPALRPEEAAVLRFLRRCARQPG